MRSSTDKQLGAPGGLWTGGVNFLDDSPFLMGISGNLIKAYGLDEMGPTDTPEAQAASDALARELSKFVEMTPPLYAAPIPVVPAAERTAAECRFTTCPWANDPHGQVPKGDGGARVIIQMGHPVNTEERQHVTMAGEPVISKNERAQIHAPPGVPQEEWRHPGEPKPSIADRAHNDTKLGVLGEASGLGVYKLSIDGWKMFHQFFYATSQLAKTGALVPLLDRLQPHKKRLGASHALVMAMGAAPASAYCQRPLNELIRRLYQEFAALEQPHRSTEPQVVLTYLEQHAALSDSWGPMDRLASAVVFTDDMELTVLGDAARAERANYAIFLSFGDGGAGMILADELKWTLSSHSLWCGVHSCPSLGIIWFGRKKRTKCIGSINAALDGTLTWEMAEKLLAFIAYVNSVLHEHPYMVSPLWAAITPPRWAGAKHDTVSFNSEERGKLKFWRKRLTTCPGTTITRHFAQQRPPAHLNTLEWLSATDARLDWVDGEWRCGLGGAVYGVLWRLSLGDEWRLLMTIPLAEFVAMVGGLFIVNRVFPDAPRIVSEIDASASATALLDKADSARLTCAHELLMEDPLWTRVKDALHVRHVWGPGNEVPDACSRDDKERAESLAQALGCEPAWTELPQAFFEYMRALARRLHHLNLPPPSTAYEQRKRSKRNDDGCEPGAGAIKYQAARALLHVDSEDDDEVMQLYSRPQCAAEWDQLTLSVFEAKAVTPRRLDALSERRQRRIEQERNWRRWICVRPLESLQSAEGPAAAPAPITPTAPIAPLAPPLTAPIAAPRPPPMPPMPAPQMDRAKLAARQQDRLARLAACRARDMPSPPASPPEQLPGNRRRKAKHGPVFSWWTALCTFTAAFLPIGSTTDLAAPGGPAMRYPLSLPNISASPGAASSTDLSAPVGPATRYPLSLPDTGASLDAAFSSRSVPSTASEQTPARLPDASPAQPVAPCTSVATTPDTPNCQLLAPLPTLALRNRLDHLIGVVGSASATRPAYAGANVDNFRSVLSTFLSSTAAAAPKNTTDGESSALRLYWVPYCDHLGISPVRSDMEAHSGRDADLFAIECAIFGGALPWIMARMKPKPGSGRTEALPTSGMKVLQHVRRVHLKRYMHPHFVPLSVVCAVCDGLCKQYIEVHGRDALMPHRKEPLTNVMINALLALFVTGVTFNGYTVDMANAGWLSLCAMFHTLAQTGFRKAEVALAAGVTWTRAHLSLADLKWMIRGKVHGHLTDALHIMLVVHGGFALLTPGVSKCDPLGLVWGACTIYLRFDAHAPICAARALAVMELARAVAPEHRALAPLFVNFNGTVWRHQPLSDIFRKMLIASGIPESLVNLYSMHSWRIYLACALLSAGASQATILALLRWKTTEALNIYARMNCETYADELAGAGQAVVSSVRTTSLAALMKHVGPVNGTHHAAFQAAWAHLAARADVTSEHAARAPVHTEDATIAELVGSARALEVIAEAD